MAHLPLPVLAANHKAQRSSNLIGEYPTRARVEALEYPYLQATDWRCWEFAFDDATRPLLVPVVRVDLSERPELAGLWSSLMTDVGLGNARRPRWGLKANEKFKWSAVLHLQLGIPMPATFGVQFDLPRDNRLLDLAMRSDTLALTKDPWPSEEG